MGEEYIRDFMRGVLDETNPFKIARNALVIWFAPPVPVVGTALAVDYLWTNYKRRKRGKAEKQEPDRQAESVMVTNIQDM